MHRSIYGFVVAAGIFAAPAVARAQQDTTPPKSSAQHTGGKVGKALDKAGSDTKHEAKRTEKHVKSRLGKIGRTIGKAGHDIKAETKRDVNRLKAKPDTAH
ncbi:MAG: hypothetical protein ABJD07_02790 [Gemmatimonadaceae bacterium]